MQRREADVCVVGAGFAGLAAARHLRNRHKTVVVLEARGRAGGRVWAKTLDNGTTVSVGGTWIGAGQDRIRALVSEVNLGLYRQYQGGVDPDDPDDPLNPCEDGAESVLHLDGKNQRYKGLFVPIGMTNLAVLGFGLEQLKALTATVPLERPWETPHARKLDGQTLGGWIESLHVPTEKARALLRASMRLLFSAEPEEVSLLGSLVLARGGLDKAFEYYANEQYTETHLVDGDGGGVPEVAVRLGRALGDALMTSVPVRCIRQSDAGVEVMGDGVTVRAKYAIVTAPPVLAARIDYQPVLPVAYGQLMRKIPAGAIWRFLAVYDTPFWRAQGLSGMSVAPDSPVPVSIDQCPKPGPDGQPSVGVLSCYSVGPKADDMSRMDPATRQLTCLRELATRFGDPALHPVAFSETDWSTEPWSCGGMIGYFPPGVLTSYGHVIREPWGRVHWAGTERATEMHGLIEGAIRSGERTADEVIARLHAT